MNIPSDDLNAEIQNFIVDFENSVQNFLNEKDSASIEVNEEAVEGIICKALHNKIIESYDKNADERLEKAFKIFSFINLSHLESKTPIENSLSLPDAISAFQAINALRTPKEKLYSLVNGCKIVSNMILNCENQNLIPTGADEFLPVLVWVILKARPEKSHANVNFIRDYRAPHRFKGLEEYYHAAFESAIEFISDLDSSKLNITHEDFVENVAKLANENGIELSTNQTNTTQETEVVEKLQEKLSSKLDNIQGRVSQYKQSIADAKIRFVGKEVYNLTVSEVPELISEYKGLVKMIADIREGVDEMLLTMNHPSETLKAQNEKSELVQSKKFFGIF